MSKEKTVPKRDLGVDPDEDESTVPSNTLNKMLDIFLRSGRVINLNEWCRADDKGYIKKWSFSEKPADKDV